MRQRVRNEASKDTVSAKNLVTPIQEDSSADIQENSTALVHTRDPSQNETTFFDPHNESYLYLGNTTELAFLNNLDVTLEDLGLDVEPVPYRGISSMSPACNKIVNLSTKSTPPSPWNYQPSNAPLFTPRAFKRRDHLVLVSVAMRVLRSYPSMITTKGSLPPFINPTSYSWAQSGGDNKVHKVSSLCFRFYAHIYNDGNVSFSVYFKVVYNWVYTINRLRRDRANANI